MLGITLVILLAARPGTPPVLDEEGLPCPEAVAALEEVELGGVNQWVLVRGCDSSNPVLLFLHGGPGMPAMPLHHDFGRELERDFVVVHWDQRGAGKSYGKSVPVESMNALRIMEDARELIELLRERHGAGKIYLVGHSWGSYLGLLLANESPALFRAYVAVGQFTDLARQRSLADLFIVREAGNRGIQGTVAELGGQGDFARRKLLFDFGAVVRGENGYDGLLRKAWHAPEYGFRDALSIKAGLEFSSDHMRYNAAAEPLTEKVTSLRIPVYFFQGRYDYVAPGELVEEYLEKLRAPAKRLVWFESSAHYPFLEEPGKFALEMKKVLKETGG